MTTTVPTDVTEISNQIGALQKRLDDLANKTPKPELKVNRFQLTKTSGIQCHIGDEVIVRTYSDGVWFGVLAQKCGEEVIIDRARMLWSFQAARGNALSGVARHGIDPDQSKICGPTDGKWCKAIGLLKPTPAAARSIREAEEHNA